MAAASDFSRSFISLLQVCHHPKATRTWFTYIASFIFNAQHYSNFLIYHCCIFIHHVSLHVIAFSEAICPVMHQFATIQNVPKLSCSKTFIWHKLHAWKDMRILVYCYRLCQKYWVLQKTVIISLCTISCNCKVLRWPVKKCLEKSNSVRPSQAACGGLKN